MNRRDRGDYANREPRWQRGDIALHRNRRKLTRVRIRHVGNRYAIVEREDDPTADFRVLLHKLQRP